MKKIINGSKYDTATAKKLGSWNNGCYTNDLNYCSEDIYRTRSGKYFIHGEGGAMSKYATSGGNNSWGWGERIEPVTRQTAMEWAEEKLDGDEYEAIFGEVSEDAEKEFLALNLSAGLKAKLRAQAEEKGISVSALVEELLGGII